MPDVDIQDGEIPAVGVGMHFDLGAVDRLAPDRYDVHITAASRRFTGDGVLHVTIRDGLISRLKT